MSEEEIKKKIKQLVIMEKPLKKSLSNYQRAIKQVVDDLKYLGEIFEIEEVVDFLARIKKKKQKIEDKLMSIQVNKQFLKASLDPYEGESDLSYAYEGFIEPFNKKLESYFLEDDDVVLQYEFFDPNKAWISYKSYQFDLRLLNKAEKEDDVLEDKQEMSSKYENYARVVGDN